jgi:hypothetical protein
MPTSLIYIVRDCLFRKTGGNVKKMYEILSKYEPKAEKVSTVSLPPGVIQSNGTNSLAWDQTKCGLGLVF